MKTIRQRATLLLIDDLNKFFEVKMIGFQFTLTLTLKSEGDVLLSMPRGKLGDYLEVGDLIEFKISGKNSCEMFNLSCQYLMFSRFKRDFISILRRLNNDDYPQKRCILLGDPGFILLSAKKNPEKINAITQATLITEVNHEKF